MEFLSAIFILLLVYLIVWAIQQNNPRAKLDRKVLWADRLSSEVADELFFECERGIEDLIKRNENEHLEELREQKERGFASPRLSRLKKEASEFRDLLDNLSEYKGLYIRLKERYRHNKNRYVTLIEDWYEYLKTIKDLMRILENSEFFEYDGIEELYIKIEEIEKRFKKNLKTPPFT